MFQPMFNFVEELSKAIDGDPEITVTFDKKTVVISATWTVFNRVASMTFMKDVLTNMTYDLFIDNYIYWFDKMYKTYKEEMCRPVTSDIKTAPLKDPGEYLEPRTYAERKTSIAPRATDEDILELELGNKDLFNEIKADLLGALNKGLEDIISNQSQE